MSRFITFAMYFLAIFLQAGAYGLTFMLPRLFADFGSGEKVVGAMLFATAISTIVTVFLVISRIKLAGFVHLVLPAWPLRCLCFYMATSALWA
jgi:hypothetical protein